MTTPDDSARGARLAQAAALREQASMVEDQEERDRLLDAAYELEGGSLSGVAHPRPEPKK